MRLCFLSKGENNVKHRNVTCWQRPVLTMRYPFFAYIIGERV